MTFDGFVNKRNARLRKVKGKKGVSPQFGNIYHVPKPKNTKIAKNSTETTISKQRKVLINACVAEYFISGHLVTIDEIITTFKVSEHEAVTLYKRINKAIEDERLARANFNQDSLGQPSLATVDDCYSASIDTIAKDSLLKIRQMHGEEIKLRGEQTEIEEGFIYLITNPAFDGWVKSGMTVDYELRLSTYNTGDPLANYRYEFVQWVSNRRKAEKKLIELLRQSSTDTRGEWHKMGLNDALKIVKKSF